MPWVHDVMVFWFTELNPKQWFSGDAEIDRKIADRFGELHAQVSAMPDAALLRDADTALAAIIVLDQMSRSLFRGTPNAFASDEKALRITDAAISRGLDRTVQPEGRIFFYLPFEHSEDQALQKRCVALTTPLGNAQYTHYALAHQAIIERFGRFPHRNVILGRPSTSDEVAFLKTPGSSF